jgi:hypothetical protein
VVFFSGESQKVSVAVFFILNTGKTVVQISTIEIPVNELLEIWAPEQVLTVKPFLMDLEKGFKMILHTPAVIGRPWIP